MKFSNFNHSFCLTTFAAENSLHSMHQFDVLRFSSSRWWSPHTTFIEPWSQFQEFFFSTSSISKPGFMSYLFPFQSSNLFYYIEDFCLRLRFLFISIFLTFPAFIISLFFVFFHSSFLFKSLVWFSAPILIS